MTLPQFFIVALMGMHQQACGQVLGFGEQNAISGGNFFSYV